MNVSVTASNIDADCVILVVVMLFVIFKLDTKYNISTAIYKIPYYECLPFDTLNALFMPILRQKCSSLYIINIGVNKHLLLFRMKYKKKIVECLQV
jgi:hypothetical protein